MPAVIGLVLPGSPVLVPEVGRGREREAVATLGACRRAGVLLRAAAPDVIVLILPADGGTTRVLVPAHDRLRRDFDRFDAPEIVRDDAVDRALIERFQQEETARHTTAVVSATLPEEALAPLYFLSGDATLPITVL